MTARVLTGSKQQIAQQVASLDCNVREAIVFVEEPISASTQPVPATVEGFFKEMEPYTSSDVVSIPLLTAKAQTVP